MPSYSPVFSTQFIVYTAETPNETFLVPEGFTAVVRQCSGWQDIGGWVFRLYIADSEAAPACVLFDSGDVGVNTSFNEQGRWVVPGGGLIGIFISVIGDSPSFYVGGYLLRNTLT